MRYPRTNNNGRTVRVCLQLALAWNLGMVTLRAGAAQPVASFAAGGTGWQLGTIGVGNLLGLREQQIVVPYRDAEGNWFVDAFRFNGQRLPGFPYAAGGEPINVSPTVCDLNGDGRDEILFTRGNHVIALRGDGSLLWSNTVDALSYVPNGGYQTVTNGFYWWPGGAWLSHLPQTAVFSSEVSPPMVADLDGTGKYQVITAWKIQPDPLIGGQDYNPFISAIFGAGPWGVTGETWSGGVVTFDAVTGRQNFVYHLHHLVESGLAVGRANPSGPLDVYVLNDSDSVVAFDQSRPFGLWGKGMLHKQFGKNQRLMTGSYQVPIDVYSADIDGDGLAEVLVAGTQLSSLWQPNETIMASDGGILWRRWLPHLDLTNNCGWLNSASLIPVNPDHDNHIDVLGWNHGYELSFRYWNGIELVDRPGWPKDFAPLLPTPPVVGDVDGDGAEEIVVGTYDPTGKSSAGALLVYALDGTLKQSIAVPGGIKQIPALADVEGLGRLDVVCLSMTGQISVWNFGSTSTDLVSWAADRGNMRRDGNYAVSLYPAGTPLVNRRTSGYNRTSFAWTNAAAPLRYEIRRALQANGPFAHIATLTAATTSYTDEGLRSGWLYFYEVGAVYSTNVILSAPFAVLSSLNGNLVANSGFERGENCRWDSWSGTAAITNVCLSTNTAYQGTRSLRILLDNQAGGSTVAQNNQYGIPDSSINVQPGGFYSFGGFFKSPALAGASEHWLEWSSTKTGSDTNSRPALPDPFYYTPHFQAGPVPADWTYLNRTFQMPAGFPNVELRHCFSVNRPGGGSVYLDNVSFRQIPSPSSSNWSTLVPFGASWRYLTQTPPVNWFAPDFDCASWLLGRAKFGAGSGPTNIATRLPQLLPRYYFRTQFMLESTNLEELLLSATCTDADVTRLYPLQLFLNGRAVPAVIDTVTMQGNEVRYFDLVPYISMLKPGTNTIGVIIGNTWSDYDDVAFDLSLKALLHEANTARLELTSGPSGGATLWAAGPSGTIWDLQTSDTLSPPNWTVLEGFTNLAIGPRALFGTGATGLPSSNGAGARFFRLVPH